MHPFNVLVPDVADRDLGPLLTTLAEAGYSDPQVTPVGTGSDSPAHAAGTPGSGDDLPPGWTPVRELEDQSYSWPELMEEYERYVIYAGTTKREGTVHIALGEAGRARVWGKDRKYLIAFLTSGAPQTPLVEFLETDDYEETREMLAIIRGRDGGRKMFGPGDSLPDVYVHQFRTALYSDYIRQPGVWRKIAVIAHEDDRETMLNHALMQARRRGDL